MEFYVSPYSPYPADPYVSTLAPFFGEDVPPQPIDLGILDAEYAGAYPSSDMIFEEIAEDAPVGTDLAAAGQQPVSTTSSTPPNLSESEEVPTPPPAPVALKQRKTRIIKPDECMTSVKITSLAKLVQSERRAQKALQAQQSRNRKKAHLESLEAEVKTLRQTVAEMKEREIQMQQRITQLETEEAKVQRFFGFYNDLRAKRKNSEA